MTLLRQIQTLNSWSGRGEVVCFLSLGMSLLDNADLLISQLNKAFHQLSQSDLGASFVYTYDPRHRKNTARRQSTFYLFVFVMQIPVIYS